MMFMLHDRRFSDRKTVSNESRDTQKLENLIVRGEI